MMIYIFITGASLGVALISLILYWTEAHKKPAHEPNQLNLLYRAQRKAQAIIGNAELAGIKVVARSKFESREMEEKFLEEIDKRGESLERKMTAEIAGRSDKILTGFETRLNEYVSGAETKTLEQMVTLVKQTEKQVEDYKKQKEELIDQKAVEVLEAALTKVIGKRLSLSDHMELVLEAIAEAKKEKFL